MKTPPITIQFLLHQRTNSKLHQHCWSSVAPVVLYLIHLAKPRAKPQDFASFRQHRFRKHHLTVSLKLVFCKTQSNFICCFNTKEARRFANTGPGAVATFEVAGLRGLLIALRDAWFDSLKLPELMRNRFHKHVNHLSEIDFAMED